MYCLTGVARREKERKWNPAAHKWETHTREICRSIPRGAGRNLRGLARGGRCLAGELAPWNYGDSSLVEAGAAIAGSGVAALTYTGGGAVAAGGSAALVAGVPMLLVGAGIMAYGGYAAYQSCQQ